MDEGIHVVVEKSWCIFAVCLQVPPTVSSLWASSDVTSERASQVVFALGFSWSKRYYNNLDLSAVRFVQSHGYVSFMLALVVWFNRSSPVPHLVCTLQLHLMLGALVRAKSRTAHTDLPFRRIERTSVVLYISYIPPRCLIQCIFSALTGTPPPPLPFHALPSLSPAVRRHPFKWVFEAGTAPSPASASATAAAAAAPAPTAALTPSDLLEQQAQMDGDLGEAARVALALEREEAAELEAAAVAAAKKADEDDRLTEELAATAASLPVIPYEVVSKMKADGAAGERKVGDAFWEAGHRSGVAPMEEEEEEQEEEEARGESTAEMGDGGERPQQEETTEEEEEGEGQDETAFFAR